MQSITTTNFAEFGYREREEMIELIKAWHEQGLPNDFYQEEVQVMFNKNSGFVFLTNSEFQVAMLNGNKLEMWNSCPNCGHEGFEEDCALNEDGCNECNPEGE